MAVYVREGGRICTNNFGKKLEIDEDISSKLFEARANFVIVAVPSSTTRCFILVVDDHMVSMWTSMNMRSMNLN